MLLKWSEEWTHSLSLQPFGFFFFLSYSYQNICNLIGHESINICRICTRSPIWQDCTTVWIWGKDSKWLIHKACQLKQNQLKQHVLIWVAITRLIKWKVNFWNFPANSADSLYWRQNIWIKFPVKFLIKFQTFWFQFHNLYANQSYEIRNHINETSGTSMEWFENASHDDIQKLIN